jgi:hypothetical protein
LILALYNTHTVTSHFSEKEKFRIDDNGAIWTSTSIASSTYSIQVKVELADFPDVSGTGEVSL